MKTTLSLTLILISTFAWAMPSAKYIPSDAAAVAVLHMPQESTFLKEIKVFLAQIDEITSEMMSSTDEGTSSIGDDLSTFESPLSAFEPYGLTWEMIRDGFVVAIPCEDEGYPFSVAFLEGTFDTDAVLAKMSNAPKILEEKEMVCGKMPCGGLYICSVQIEERVKALLAGKETAISPTSAFAKLVNEKNDPNRLAIRALAKGGKGGLRGILGDGDIMAVKASLIERTPGVVAIDAMYYTKTQAAILKLDAQMQGIQMVSASLLAESPALKWFFADFLKVTTDMNKKRLMISGAITMENIKMLRGAFFDFINMPALDKLMVENVAKPESNEAEPSLPNTSPVFKIEKLEDLLANKLQSKVFTIEGYSVYLRAEESSTHHTDYATGVESTKSGVIWRITSPKKLDITKMTVTQGDKTFPLGSPGQDFSTKNVHQKSCSMFATTTGAVDITFEYSIK